MDRIFERSSRQDRSIYNEKIDEFFSWTRNKAPKNSWKTAWPFELKLATEIIINHLQWSSDCQLSLTKCPYYYYPHDLFLEKEDLHLFSPKVLKSYVKGCAFSFSIDLFLSVSFSLSCSWLVYVYMSVMKLVSSSVHFQSILSPRNKMSAKLFLVSVTPRGLKWRVHHFVE